MAAHRSIDRSMLEDCSESEATNGENCTSSILMSRNRDRWKGSRTRTMTLRKSHFAVYYHCCGDCCDQSRCSHWIPIRAQRNQYENIFLNGQNDGIVISYNQPFHNGANLRQKKPKRERERMRRQRKNAGARSISSECCSRFHEIFRMRGKKTEKTLLNKYNK